MVVAKLQKTILSIFLFPRGFHGFREMLENCSFSTLLAIQAKEVLKLSAGLLDQHVFNSASNYFDNEAPFQLDEVLFSGSLSEGTMTANLRKKLVSDTDFMFVLKNIKVTEEDQKKRNLSVKEDTPYVNLNLTDDGLITTWAVLWKRQINQVMKTV